MIQLTPEARDILSTEEGEPIAVRQPMEVVQSCVDTFKDTTKRNVLLDNVREGEMFLDRALKMLYPLPSTFGHPLDYILYDAGVDISRDRLGKIGTKDNLEKNSKRFWEDTYPAIAVDAIARHRFFQNFLGEANVFTGRPKASARVSAHQWNDESNMVDTRLMPTDSTRAGSNTVDTISTDEPVITYVDRPIRDSERTMFDFSVQDITAEVIPLPAGTLNLRGVVSNVEWDDEQMQTAMEGTNGLLVQIDESKNEWELREYKIGIRTTDEFIAGNIRMQLLMRTQARIGRLFGRACLIRAMNKIAGALKTGNTRYGQAYTQTSTNTSFTGQQWGQLEDSYEVETMNRVIGKKPAIRAIKEMNMGTDYQTYAQYMQRPTQFYDLGGAFADIGLGGINSSSLNSAFTNKAFFVFDVMSTLLLVTAPWLEQDEQTRDAGSGSVLTSMRTAITEEVEDANSIRKATWA